MEKEELKELARALPRQERIVLLLAYADGLTLPEIAQVTGDTLEHAEHLLVLAQETLKANVKGWVP